MRRRKRTNFKNNKAEVPLQEGNEVKSATLLFCWDRIEMKIYQDKEVAACGTWQRLLSLPKQVATAAEGTRAARMRCDAGSALLSLCV